MPKRNTLTEIKKLQEKLLLPSKPVWDIIDDAEKGKVYDFSKEYIKFLDDAKTEREAVEVIVRKAKERGYSEIGTGKNSEKVFAINRNKAVAMAVIGRKPLMDGLRLVASHIDAPRLDLKQKPLYEDTDMVFLKTHYYGGIKKYQWVTRPLALHGLIVKKNGEKMRVSIGDGKDDPVFVITDLLPHLARKTQYEKKLPEIIVGEKLNLLVGALPFPEKEAKERFKLNILSYLTEQFGLIEEDFISAEIEVVPAEKSRDVGFDRSMVGGYGQDDRSSAFTSLEAILSIEKPTFTSISLFLDKEEIGSEGNTGAQSRFIENFIFDLAKATGTKVEVDIINRVLSRSKAISADVAGAIDPDFQEVHEKRNDPKMGYGVCLTKYTGAGGKYGASDANAEYVGWIRSLLNEKKVVWQVGGLGKVDEGGGGTVAKFLATYGMDIIDMGAPVLSMHSPFEITHKADLYMTFKAIQAFLQAD